MAKWAKWAKSKIQFKSKIYVFLFLLLYIFIFAPGMIYYYFSFHIEHGSRVIHCKSPFIKGVTLCSGINKTFLQARDKVIVITGKKSDWTLLKSKTTTCDSFLDFQEEVCKASGLPENSTCFYCSYLRETSDSYYHLILLTNEVATEFYTVNHDPYKEPLGSLNDYFDLNSHLTAHQK